MHSSFRSRVAAGSAALVLSVLASGGASAQPLYHVQDLGADSYPEGHLTPEGKIAGSFQRKAAYWNGDHWVLLDGAKAATGGVASSGETAGTKGYEKGPFRARVWTPKGHHRDILPDASASYATAVSANGVVYGYAVPNNVDPSYAFAWQHGQLTILPPDDSGNRVIPRAANRAGQIVGDYGGELYSGGVWTRLPGFYLTRGLNDQGAVVGSSGTADGGEAVMYQDGVTTDLGFPGIAYDINNAGDIVGIFVIDNEHYYAVLLKSGTKSVIRLDQVVDQLPGTFQWASSINDAGTISIYGLDASGHTHVYLLTPIDSAGPRLSDDLLDY